MQSILLAGRKCLLSIPKGEIPPGGFPLVLSNDGDMPAADFDTMFAEGRYGRFVFLAIPPLDRNREYTPWEAPALAQNSPAFPGGGGEYLRFLTEELLPHAQNTLPVSKDASCTALRGYSLGGLHALWSGTQCEAFGRIACLSGSLWYDGATGYFEGHALRPAVKRVYLSLGVAEERARNPRMARVGSCTRAVHRIIQSSGIACTLDWNPGGHFRGIPERFRRAFDWLFI